MRKNNYIIPRDKYEAYKKYITSFRLLGHGEVAERMFNVYVDRIVLNLDDFIILSNYPKVVQIPDFVDEVV